MVFFDSNVLVYIAIDQDPVKKAKAKRLAAEVMRANAGWISLQVLRELANCMFKKSKDTLEEIQETIEWFAQFRCVRESMETLKRGMALKARHGLQFHDALVVAAAEEAGCDTVYSEDMGNGSVYGGVRVMNPFAE
ncbi:MAG: PIN domain-containing protein [Kiritimatiellae bacterium]|nr:PIN domain-containing protein [Kiritimatiellia bacterium]